jgi:hypothetical protein
VVVFVVAVTAFFADARFSARVGASSFLAADADALDRGAGDADFFAEEGGGGGGGGSGDGGRGGAFRDMTAEVGRSGVFFLPRSSRDGKVGGRRTRLAEEIFFFTCVATNFGAETRRVRV